MKLAADLDMPGGDAKAQEIWRAAMVDKAETENKRRLELWEKDKTDEGPEGSTGKGKDASAVEKSAMEGESHTLTATKTDKGVTIVMASTPGELGDKIDRGIELCSEESTRIAAEKKTSRASPSEEAFECLKIAVVNGQMVVCMTRTPGQKRWDDMLVERFRHTGEISYGVKGTLDRMLADWSFTDWDSRDTGIDEV